MMNCRRWESGGDFSIFASAMVFWYKPDWLEGAVAAKSDFHAQDDDVLLSSQPKSGITRLKALVVAIMDSYVAWTASNMNDAIDQYDLLAENLLNDLIPSLEIQIFNPKALGSPIPRPTVRGRPRLYQTHVPYGLLSESIKLMHTSGTSAMQPTNRRRNHILWKGHLRVLQMSSRFWTIS